ncbi:MAG TPA: hypothetical protein VGX91_13440 [Candidatus Cybelea sp.]|nr:hypothetical protein [Candidatus Cybelea sp.]
MSGDLDIVRSLAARYCLRQDARGFLELLAFLVVLAAAAVATLRSMRRRAADADYRRAASVWAGGLACAFVLSLGVGLTIFRWCAESAGPALGVVLPTSPQSGLDAMICYSMNAVRLIEGWIVVVVAAIAAIGLFAVGVFARRSWVSRAVALAGAVVALLFATASGFLILFSMSWCQSHRLF